MQDWYMITDCALDNPYHQGIILDNKDDRQFTVTDLFGHYGDFDFTRLVNKNFISALPKKAKKFVFDFAHMPFKLSVTLTPDIISFIKKDPNAYLLVFSHLEIIVEEDQLLEAYKKVGIPANKIICLVSNPHYHKKTINGIFFYDPDHWESICRYQIKNLPTSSFLTPEQRLQSKKHIDKKFLSLNRNIKHHRVWWWYALRKNKVLDQCYASYHGPRLNPVEHKATLFDPTVLKKFPTALQQEYIRDAQRMCRVKSLDPIDQIDKGFVINHTKSINEYYKRSAFSIITESLAHIEYPSEKTFKVISHCHPFIIIGTKRFSTELQSRGYKTFEDFFDMEEVNDYHSAVRLIKRIKKRSLEDINNKVFNEFWDRIEHNYNLFMYGQNPWRNIITDLLAYTNK